MYVSERRLVPRLRGLPRGCVGLGMKRNIAVASSVLGSLLASLLVGCVADDAVGTTGAPQTTTSAPAPSGPQPTPAFAPASCADIAKAHAGSKDGDYALYIAPDATTSYSWTAYCADMQTASPREYLSLANGANTSMFASGAAQVVTVYEKIRIDPASFAVDLGDTTFASSTGSAVANGSTITSMPYGVAMSCGGAAATMNIDLHGTPFRLEQPFSRFGTDAQGTVTLSTDRKSLSQSVTGNCAWVAPKCEREAGVGRAAERAAPRVLPVVMSDAARTIFVWRRRNTTRRCWVRSLRARKRLARCFAGSDSLKPAATIVTSRRESDSPASTQRTFVRRRSKRGAQSLRAHNSNRSSRRYIRSHALRASSGFPKTGVQRSSSRSVSMHSTSIRLTSEAEAGTAARRCERIPPSPAFLARSVAPITSFSSRTRRQPAAKRSRVG